MVNIYKMSLVVCSNQSSDATSVARDQSIFKPYSFRNALSSTLTLPKNCQVALESVKYNLDGTITLSEDSYVLYLYFGETINIRQGDTMDNSTAYPIRVPLVSGKKGQVKEFTFEDLVAEIQSQLNKYIYHPNLRDSVSCEIRRNSATNELEGIKIDVDEFETLTNVVPSNASEFANSFFLQDGQEAGWSYTAGEFVVDAATTSASDIEPVAILTDSPISLGGGKLVVSFMGVENSNWRVGLSRYTTPYDPTGSGLSGAQDGYFAPMYFDIVDGMEEGPVPGADGQGGFFADFCVANVNGTLKFCHTAINSSTGSPNDIQWLDIAYGNNQIPNNYNISTNASQFEKVEFECKGEKIRVRMLDADDNACVLYDYNDEYSGNELAKPINQACWTMYPVLSIARGGEGDFLQVETFNPCSNISNHDILDEDNSWYQSQYRNEYGNSAAMQIETRPWNDVNRNGSDVLTQVGINASGIINLPLKLILSPSAVYTPSFGANSGPLLGFTTALKQFGHIASPVGRRQLLSTVPPRLLSAKTIFVRLENFTTNSTNAHQGNQSKIIAHLPRFDGQVETGRIFHQPNTLIYLDLNNSEELKVNSFDISFCYSNEQYATSLTGQSVVVLHFRSKES